MYFLFFVFILQHILHLSQQSHFRGGSITARPLSFTANDVTLELTLTFSWRSDFPQVGFYCDQTTIDNNLLTGPSNHYLVCRKIGNTPCSSVLTSCDTYCQAFSLPTADNWTYGKKTITLTIPQAFYYEASYNNTAWMKLNGGGSESDWEVRIRMDTRPRSDTSEINTTPIATMPPIVKFRKGIKLTIPISWADADYTDDVRCRWATASNQECGGVCQDDPNPAYNQFNTTMLKAVPPATLNETACMLTFDGTLQSAIAPGYYAVALQIEDFMSKEETQPLSSIPLQFLIQLININSACMDPPVFIGDRQQSGCYGAPIGQLYKDRMIVQVQCPSATLLSLQVLGLTGGHVSSMYRVQSSQQWAIDITWTPTQQQYGPNVVCGYATDSTYLIAFNCYTIVVGVAPPSLSITQTKSPSGNLTRSNVLIQANGLIKWSLDFNQKINKAILPSYIKIYSKENDTLVVSLDATGTHVNVHNQTLIFETKSDLFDVGGNFYILMDYGVATGTLFCNPASDQIKDKTFWTFSFESLASQLVKTTTNKSYDTSALISGTVVGGLCVMGGGVAGGAFIIFRLLKRKVKPEEEPLDTISPETPLPETKVQVKKKKTRMAGANVQDKNFNLNINHKTSNNLSTSSTPQQQVFVQPLKEIKPPSKNKMMGPLIKNKTFNLPLEDSVKNIIDQTRNNFA